MNVFKGFLGANSANGFYSYFDSCIDYQKNGKLFILKGGSGSGKSTLMKKTRDFLLSLGLDAQDFYCSSDIDSLDGIYCEKLNIGVIDGTAPHVVDPKLYGVHDEIINMGDCLKSYELKDKKAEIIDIAAQKKQLYNSVYAHISSSGKLFLDACDRYASDSVSDMLGVEAYNFFEKLSLVRGNMQYPFYRKIFVSAFTPSGYYDFSDEYLQAKNTYVLTGGFDNIYSNFLYMVANYSKMFVSRIDYFMHPLCPDMIMGLYLKDIDTVILSQSFLRKKGYSNYINIDLKNCFKNKMDMDIVEKDIKKACEMLDNSYEFMAKAKSLHERLESLYKPHMDFEKVNGNIAKIISKIQE